MNNGYAVVLGCAIALLLSGCATHQSETQAMRAAWYAGDTAKAQKEALAREKDRQGGDSALIWALETGAVTRANGDLGLSESCFSKAYELVETYDAQAKTKLTEEAASVLLNQSFTRYRGFFYDKIMMSAYQALNCMEQKKFEQAAVELRRVQNFQETAVDENRARIEREEQLLRQAQKKDGKQAYDVERTLANSNVQSVFEKYYGAGYMQRAGVGEARAIYTNPFATWLGGLYFSNRFADQADKDRAADLFRLAFEQTGKSVPAIAADVADAEQLANGTRATMGNVVYVVFEIGSAAIRDQFKLDLPLYIFANDVPHVAINFPYLVKTDSFAPSVTVQAGQNTAVTQRLVKMDDIIEREFKNELPTIITKSILSSAMKAAAQYFAQQATNNDYRWAVAIAGSLFQSLLNDADLRTWTTLPKEISIARLPAPDDGLVIVQGRNIWVEPEGVSVVWVKQMSAQGRMIIRTFNFKD